MSAYLSKYFHFFIFSFVGLPFEIFNFRPYPFEMEMVLLELEYDYILLGGEYGGITYWRSGEEEPIYWTTLETPIIPRPVPEVVMERPPRRVAALKCEELNSALFEALDAYGEEF